MRSRLPATILAVLLLFAGCDGTTEIAASGSGGSAGAPATGGAGGLADAGPDVELDGGASDPGNVTCNGGPCASADHHCCEDFPQGAETCVPSTVSSCVGLRRTCDEAADCPSPQVCCIPPNQAIALAYNTQCVDSCNGDPFAYQVCKTDGECQNGMPCVAQPCQGHVIQSCGALPMERCQ